MTKIRLATIEDLKSIKRIANQNREFIGFVMNVALKESIDKKSLFVAECEELENKGEVIGFVHYHARRDGWHTLHEIGIDKKFQKRRIGSLLLGIVPAPTRLKTTTDNLNAIRFYIRHGFGKARLEAGKKRELLVFEKSQKISHFLQKQKDLLDDEDWIILGEEFKNKSLPYPEALTKKEEEFMVGLSFNFPNIFRKLLNIGFSVDMQDRRQRTLLSYGSYLSEKDLRFCLEELEIPANVNHQDDEGNTVLHSMVKNVEFENPKNLLYILKKGGNPLIKNNANLDVFEYFQTLPFSSKDSTQTNEILKKWKAEYDAKNLKVNLPKAKVSIRLKKI